MGYKGYGPHRQWVTWVTGYMGNGVQGYGQMGNGAHGQFAPKKMSSCQKDVKLSKRCQVVKKMSSCQKDVKCQIVKHLDYGGGSQKNINRHNEVHTY